MDWLLGSSLVGSLGVIGALIGGAAWLVKRTLDAGDARRLAEVNAADLHARLANAVAAADTADRLRRLETARANALEEELAHADQAQAATPDASARRRVLARWRESSAVTAVPTDATSDRGDADRSMPVPAAAPAKR